MSLSLAKLRPESLFDGFGPQKKLKLKKQKKAKPPKLATYSFEGNPQDQVTRPEPQSFTLYTPPNEANQTNTSMGLDIGMNLLNGTEEQPFPVAALVAIACIAAAAFYYFVFRRKQQQELHSNEWNTEEERFAQDGEEDEETEDRNTHYQPTEEEVRQWEREEKDKKRYDIIRRKNEIYNAIETIGKDLSKVEESIAQTKDAFDTSFPSIKSTLDEELTEMEASSSIENAFVLKDDMDKRKEKLMGDNERLAKEKEKLNAYYQYAVKQLFALEKEWKTHFPEEPSLLPSKPIPQTNHNEQSENK